MHRVGLALPLLLIGLLLAPRPAVAQIEEVRIAVDGLTCTLCAAGLERSLRRMDDVSNVEIAVAEESAIVRLKSGRTFDPDTFRTAVKNAGQQVRTFELRVNGTVREQNGRYSVQPGNGTPLVVTSQSASRLKPFVGRTIQARGRVLTQARARMELELIDVVAR